MNVAITGGTQGLGKYLTDCLIADGHGVLNYSRTNGYNIDSTWDRTRIVNSLNNIDVFINNAYNYDIQTNSQLRLLSAIFNNWYSQEKILINISSIAAFSDITKVKDSWWCAYITNKQLQNKFAYESTLVRDPAKKIILSNICPDRLSVGRGAPTSPNPDQDPKYVYNIVRDILTHRISVINLKTSPTY